MTVIKRPSSSATFPESVTVQDTDLSSVEAVTKAFRGQDAVVSTVGEEGLVGQTVFIEAAVAAEVKRFLPSDYGCDIGHPKAGSLPVFGRKVAIHNALREASASNPNFTYSLVTTGPILDWALEHNIGINWKDDKIKLYDGGKSHFSATMLDSIGQAVVGVLSHPEETKNRFVYVKDIDISQNQLLDIVKKANASKVYEEPAYIDTADLEKSSYESLARGEFSFPIMLGFLYRIIFGPPEYGGRYTETDNELLGVKGKTLTDVEAFFRSLIRT